jgi:amino acid permease
MGRSPAGYACCNRGTEWACTLMLIGWGMTCLISPDTIGKGAFRYLLAIGVTQYAFTWFCIVVGLVRLVALIFNGGGLPWSARVRAMTAILGGVAMAHLAWCLAFLSKDTGVISIGVITYIILAGVEIFSATRAGADVNEKNAVGATGSKRSIVARIITNDTTEREPTGLASVRGPGHPQL